MCGEIFVATPHMLSGSFEKGKSVMITIRDTIKRAISIKGYEILKNKKNLCMLLEDLSPDFKEEREFIGKTYSDGLGRILYEACITDATQREEYLQEANLYLENNYGFNKQWRNRLLSYFVANPSERKDTKHKVLFRVLSQGEDRRNLEMFSGDSILGSEISKHLSEEPLMRTLYDEKAKAMVAQNIGSNPWTIVGRDLKHRICNAGQVQLLEPDTLIRIAPKIAQLNVISIQ